MSDARNPAPAAARLFISYRRDDSAGYARALNDRLAQQFGDQRVFIDVDDIPAGAAFDATIAQALGGAAVLLVLIGPRWLAPGADGRPRLHDAADFVHREVAAGLAGGAQVIPLLLDGAAMPGADQLPPALQPLAVRQAQVIDARRFAADTDALLARLHLLLGEVAAPAPAPAGPRRAGLLGGAVALLAAAGAGWWLLRPAPLAPPRSPPEPSPAARGAVNGRWQAAVRYDWPGADFTETLVLQGEGRTLAGTASFLRVPRGIEQGEVDGDILRFVTRSSEQLGGAERTVTHRFSGRLDGDLLRLTMQTEGAAQPHAPVEVLARRVPAP
jgi:hypothetical protein